MNRSIAAILTSFALITAGCGKGSTPAPDGGPDGGGLSCQTLADCPQGNVCDTHTNHCIPVCHSSAECAATQVCEEGSCLAPACGGPGDCSSGQACVGGTCKPAPTAAQVTGCDLVPSPAVVHVGSTLQLSVLPHDSAGKPLYYSGATTWAAASGGSVDASGLVTASAAGVITVTATIGTASCMAAVTSYAAADAGALRVTVIDQHTKAPIVGAKVVLDAVSNTKATGGDGTASFAGVTGVHNVHVFAAGYNYVSFIQTTATDLLVPISAYVPTAQRSGFTGHMCSSKGDDATCADDDQFSTLAVQGEAVHLAFFGSGIPNSLLDLSVDTLVGPSHSVTVSIAGNSKPLNLPYGLVLGVGSNLFGTQDYRMYADGGKRTLWGIGGNVNLTQVVTALGPVLTGGGGNVDVGTILPEILPLLAKLQAGTAVNVSAPVNSAPGGTPTFTPIDLALTTPLRLRLTTTSPDLPKVDGKYVDGVIALAGALDYPQGFVPLGFTAGLAYKDSNNAANGKIVDPSCDTSGGTLPCATNKLPLKFAAENGGTEGSSYGVALIALNLGSLSGGVQGSVALSGLIGHQPQVHYVAPPADGPAPDSAFGAFLNMPNTNTVTLTKTGRQVSVTQDADAKIQVYRFDLENAARLGWELWMPPTNGMARSLTLPDPHAVDASFVDPLQDAVSSTGTTGGPSARVLGMQLGATACAGAPCTAAALETFGSLTLDQIGANLTGFIAASVPVAQ